MHTLDQIMKKAPEEDTTSGATTADVMADKKFWGLTGGQWGLQTGDGDPNLVAGNIKDGVTIFGVTGELHGGCTCSGTLVGTRWCDNGDGTVTDLTTCLVWLKDASWGERRPWRDPDGYDDAHKRAGILKDGTADAELSDSSVEGDWRLPTLEELKALTTGTEPVSSGNMQAFSGVQADGYWSSTTFTGYTGCAWFMALENGEAVVHGKGNMFWVWPVRAGQ